MSEKLILTQQDCVIAANQMANSILMRHPKAFKIFGVPRGGVPVAYLLMSFLKGSALVNNPADAHIIVDDIVDSGVTKLRFEETYNKPFYALTDFMEVSDPPRPWIVFPWEQGLDEKDTSADDIITRLLQYIGEDPTREGLKETPARVLKAWKEWTSGYAQNPFTIMKCFEDGSENYDEMVVVRDLPFYSHCEHHLAPFFGTATIAYIPTKRIVGLSKLGRLLEIYSRRLQVQERMTTQIANVIQKELQPKGCGVILRARHLCMESRGLNRQGHHTITSALRGVFLEDKVRAEFLAMAK
jgi:GTP cyclohydrolase I